MGATSISLKILIREGLMVLGLLAYLFILNWQLTAIFLLVTPVIAWVVAYASKKFRKHSKRIQASMGDVTHIVTEAIKGYRVVRTFGAEKFVQGKFVNASARNLKQNMRLVATSAISTPVIQFVVACAMAFLIWVAMYHCSLIRLMAGSA